MVKGSQATMDPLQVGKGEYLTFKANDRRLIAYGGTMWNALTAEMRRARAENTANFMTGA